jgi:2-polyprenyl-3-methyl-5-hydroxy-6-metoxy-1,4-benzoquinol methylase
MHCDSMSAASSEEVVAKDLTFRNYSTDQASHFAQQRRSYSSVLYQIIRQYHTASDGEFHSLLDVGCGSGAATRGLAGLFLSATGIDCGQELIKQAWLLGGQTKSGKLIQYEVLEAENMCLSQTLKPGSVDLLSVGMAVGDASSRNVNTLNKNLTGF